MSSKGINTQAGDFEIQSLWVHTDLRVTKGRCSKVTHEAEDSENRDTGTLRATWAVIKFSFS